MKVFSAAASDAGTVGAWTPGAALPEAVFYHAGAAVNGHLYVLGGYHYSDADGLAVSNVVYHGKIGADGAVGAWQTATPLPEPVFFPSAAAWNGRIYVTGGWNGAALVNKVYSAEVREDGSLGLWVAQKSLPEAVYTHAAVSNGTLYVLGGTVNGGADIQNSVSFAKINADGTLADWAATTPLPSPVSNHGAVVANGRVIVLGGWTGAAPTAAVQSSLVEAAGSLGAWSAEAPLPRPLYLLATAASPSHVFVSGGIDTVDTRNAVYSLPLPAAPAPLPPPVAADSLPPRTTIAFGSPFFGGAPFISPNTPATLAAVDDARVVGDGAGVGVASTQWAVDDGAFSAYAAPIHIAAEGSHSIRFQSVDAAGNAEAPRSTSFLVDATAPQSALSVEGGTTLFGQDLAASGSAVSLSAVDPLSGGVAAGIGNIVYSVDGGADQTYAAPFRLNEGRHTVSFGATDRVGNVEERRTVAMSPGAFLTAALTGLDSVVLSGQAAVTGDVMGRIVTLNGKSSVSGTITQGPAAAAAPAYDLGAARTWARANNNNAVIPGANLNGGALTLTGGSLELPAGDYYLTGLSLSGQSRLTISGRVNIFLHGPLSVSGGAEFNTTGEANDLWIIADAGDASLSGNSRAAFNLFAPLSAVSVAGNGEFAGRVLGKTAALSGKALQPSTTALPPSTHLPKGDLKHTAPPPIAAPTPNAPSVRVQHVKSSMPALALSARAAFATVGSGGSAVRAKDRTAVVIPEGAATAGLGVTVSPPKTSDVLENKRQSSDESRKGLVAAASGVQYGPEGTHFAKPVTLELPYDRASLPKGVAENELSVHYWNPVNGGWEKLQSSVDTQNQIVRAQTTHFSLYQIFSGGSGTGSTGDDFHLREMYAFPNPAHGGSAVTIRVQPGPADSVSVRIYDLMGRLVHESASIRNRGSFDDGNGSGAQSTFEYVWNASGVEMGVYSYVVTARKLGSSDIGKTGKIVVLP